MVNWTVYWRFPWPDWPPVIQTSPATVFSVIHDKRERRLVYVTQIIKCENSSFALS